MKFKVLILLLFSARICFSQVESAYLLYNLGINAFNDKQYLKADSLFSLSARFKPDVDTYFNLALVKEVLNDTCGFCDCLAVASKLGDTDAKKLLRKCFRFDTIFYLKKTEMGKRCCYVTAYDYCTHMTDYTLLRETSEEGKFERFCILSDEQNIYTENEIYSDDFEIEKVPLKNIFVENCVVVPSFSSGDDGLRKFLKKNISYPPGSKEKGREGTVFVRFEITKEGGIENIVIIGAVGDEIDKEVMRVVAKMPKWNPGKKSQNPERFKYYLPIKFTLQ